MPHELPPRCSECGCLPDSHSGNCSALIKNQSSLLLQDAKNFLEECSPAKHKIFGPNEFNRLWHAVLYTIKALESKP